jgi:serine-type D-Ala-D-Ala carboxypeptidase (penicillin-binding protein 5/6)
MSREVEAAAVGWSRFYLIVASVLSITFLVAQPEALAARHFRRRLRRRHRVVRVAAPLYHGALLEVADTGQVLLAQNADMEWPPASMAKMMLILVAEEQIKDGRFSINDPVRISERAAQTGGSRLGLRQGEIIPLGELIKAALIRSANDAAVAIAEKIGGSVEGSVRLMNDEAGRLGMNHTQYRTVDGLPPRPGHDVDITDAYDLARVARELIHHTNVLQLTSLPSADFDDGVAILRNTNHLVGHFEGCDGLKTGFTYQAGFNLTATAKRGDMRLIAVILGAPSNPQRFRQAARVMEWGFDNFEKVALVRQGQPLPVHVQVESGPVIQPIAASDIELVVPKDQVNDLSLDYSVPTVVSAPIPSGTTVGQVIVRDGSQVLARVDAICPVPVGDVPEPPLANTLSLPAAAADHQPPTSPAVYQPQESP